MCFLTPSVPISPLSGFCVCPAYGLHWTSRDSQLEEVGEGSCGQGLSKPVLKGSW